MMGSIHLRSLLVVESGGNRINILNIGGISSEQIFTSVFQDIMIRTNQIITKPIWGNDLPVVGIVGHVVLLSVKKEKKESIIVLVNGMKRALYVEILLRRNR
jgi:hypothetical protein